MTEQKQAGSERPGGEEICAAVVAAFDASGGTGSDQPPDPVEIREQELVASETPEGAGAPTGPQDSGKPKDGNSGNNNNPEPATELSEPDRSAALVPPANWKTSDKEIFNTLPEPAQKFLLDRHKAMEADHTRKTQAIAEFRREYEPVDQLFAPHRAFMKERGISSREVIEYWADIERRLGQGDGVNVIRGIAQGYAIDPAQIAAAFGFSGPASPGGQQTTSPAPGAPGPALPLPARIEAALADIPRIKERLAAEDRARAQAARAAADAARAQRATDIENFRSATDRDGNLLHPYAAEVEEDMVQLALIAQARGQAVPPLQELYEKAVRANPSTYQALRIAEAQSAQQRQKDEARAKAAAAKKAGSSVTGAPGPGQPPPGKPSARSLREEILAQFDDGN